MFNRMYHAEANKFRLIKFSTIKLESFSYSNFENNFYNDKKNSKQYFE